MKKFWVGLLSLFVLFGGILFASCDKNNTIRLEIIGGDTYKEICLNDGEDDNSVVFRTRVRGTGDGSVNVSAPSNVTYTNEYNSSTGISTITITGKTVGLATITISSTVNNGEASETVYVDVFNQATELNQAKDEKVSGGRLKQYVVRGQENLLDAKLLIAPTPADAKLDITWVPVTTGVTINDNILTLDDLGEDVGAINILARDKRGQEVNIELPVIDDINQNGIKLEYQYNQTMFTGTALDEGQTIEIIPNWSSEGLNKQTVFFRVSFDAMPKQTIVVEPLINGKTEQEYLQNPNIENPFDKLNISQLSVSPDELGDKYNGKTVRDFSVKIGSNYVKTLKENFDVTFRVGYEDYDFGKTTVKTDVFCHQIYDTLNIRNEQGQIITDGTTDIYTFYSPNGTNKLGAKFTVDLAPVKAVGTGYYNIKVAFPADAGVDEDTLQVVYQAPDGKTKKLEFVADENAETGYAYTILQKVGNLYPTTADALEKLPNQGGAIFVSAQNVKRTIDNVALTITSMDNQTLEKTTYLNIYSSADSMDLTAPSGAEAQGDLIINTEKVDEDGNLPFAEVEFKLQGQTTTKGLYVDPVGEIFNSAIKTPITIQKVSELDNAIIFKVKFELSSAGFLGYTGAGTYQIKHENGLESEKFDFKLMLPLTEGTVKYEGNSSGVTYYQAQDNMLYQVGRDSLVSKEASTSLNHIVVKLGSTVPLKFTTNSVNGKNAVPDEISFMYADYTEEPNMTELWQNAETSSDIVSLKDGTITTLADGKVWVLTLFKQEGTTLIRFTLVECIVAPVTFRVDKKSVTVYAENSVTADEEDLTKKEVSISFMASNLTYGTLEYFRFSTQSMLENNPDDWKTASNNYLKFDNFELLQISPGVSSLNFVIRGLSTGLESSFVETLVIQYYSPDGLWIPLSDDVRITILNADRVEKLKVQNLDTVLDEDTGIYDYSLYFEVGDKSLTSSPLIMTTTPDNAKNHNIKFIYVNQNLQEEDFVYAEAIGNAGNHLVRLKATEGMIGYIYALPADACNNGLQYFLTYSGNVPNYQKMELSDLYSKKFDGLTGFEYLVLNNAKFLNNNKEEVYLRDILVRIKVTIADGRSEQLAYRVYTSEDLTAITPNNWYRVMNDLTVSDWTSKSFNTGFGITGEENYVITILSGQAFVNENNGTIKNLTFAGNVEGQGFVANRNNGRIEDVTIDSYAVNEEGKTVFKSSTVTSATYAGGVVGENAGILNNVRALGQTVNASEYAGGLVGRMTDGVLTNGRVEFYRFKDGYNKITAKVVGGVIGQLDKGTVSNIYAYDYHISAENKLVGTSGLLVGKLTQGLTISKSFAVVNNGKGSVTLDDIVAEKTEEVNLQIANGYFAGGVNTIFVNDAGTMVDSTVVSGQDWIKDGDEGFLDYVNGGQPYLRDFYQDEPITEETINQIKVKDVVDSNFYKALAVGDAKDKAILFNYRIDEFIESGLNASGLTALKAYNTIAFKDIIGTLDASKIENIKISSSNTSKVEIEGSSIIVRATTDNNTKLTFASRQDYTIDRDITIKVIYALSSLDANRSYASNDEVKLERIYNGGSVDLHRGKEMTVDYSFARPSVYLGDNPSPYTLITNGNYSIKSNIVAGSEIPEKDVTDSKSVTINTASNKMSFSYKTAEKTYKTTGIETYIDLGFGADETDFANAVKEAFKHTFTLNLFRGAFEIRLNAEDVVTIGPSLTDTADVTLKTNDPNDTITMEISLVVGDELVKLQTKDDGEKTIYSYKASSTLSENRIEVVISEETDPDAEPDENGLYTKKFKIYISVCEDYKYKIDEVQNYKVKLLSASLVESEEFDLVITTQAFQRLTTANYMVDEVTYNLTYGFGYTIDMAKPTSVLVPGYSSIYLLNINPPYAYYNQVSIQYDGITALGGLNITKLTENGNKFYEDSTAVVQRVGNRSVFTIDRETDKSTLYFRLDLASILNPSDKTVTLTISFYDKHGEHIQTIYDHLTISQFLAPRIVIEKDNADPVAYIAKGESLQVQVILPYEYELVSLDSITLDGNFQGIELQKPWEITPSEDAGVMQTVYTTQLIARTNASLAEDANGRFVMKAVVKRTVNGREQTETIEAEIMLVDFRINMASLENHISIGQGNRFIAYKFQTLPLDFEYSVLPDLSRVTLDEELSAERNFFESHGYYENGYYDDGELVSDERTADLYINVDPESHTPIPIYQRLKYNDRGQWVSLFVDGEFDSIGGRFLWSYDSVSERMSVQALKVDENDTIQMRLEMTMQIGEYTWINNFDFTIDTRIYSDEDTPILIETAQDFLNLNPNSEYSEDNIEEDRRGHYILMNDIVLQNYTPFATSRITTFDGNGYTIFIESFNNDPVENANRISLNLALFTTVSPTTLLKNIRVNLYNGGKDIKVDINKYNNIQIAGFANTNNGIITNCEVVSFNNGTNVNVIGKTGLTVNYTRGDTPININGNNATSLVAGFVNANNGSITNSRVGGDTITVLGKQISDNAGNFLYYEKDTIKLEEFYLEAEGNVAGFVNTNTQTIASSFVKRIHISNDSDNTNLYTSGFAGINTKNILTSFIEGVDSGDSVEAFIYKGSSISSKQGIIAGFVYQNNSGKIQDCYSNIRIENVREDSAQDDARVFLASGFVYYNGAVVENCFSASQVRESVFSQMNFSGVNSAGVLQASETAQIVNSYYYTESNAEDTDSIYKAGATKLAGTPKQEALYGFSFTADKESEISGIWLLDEDKTSSNSEQVRITLVEANRIAFSNRYYQGYLDETTGEERYVLPYSTIYDRETNEMTTLAYGSSINPIVISSADEFVKDMDTSTSTYIQMYYTDTTIRGNYRLVNDISFSSGTDEEGEANIPTSHKAFSGRLFGNGFTISGVSLTSGDSTALGLFASIENAVVINLNVEVVQVVNDSIPFVGGLAGLVRDSKIANITITNSADTGRPMILGQNFAGGLAGIVFGNTTIKNITINSPKVSVASKRGGSEEMPEDSSKIEDVAYSTLSDYASFELRLALRQMLVNSATGIRLTELSDESKQLLASLVENYSYAGGAYGYLDLFTDSEYTNMNYNFVKERAIKDYKISKTHIYGSINVEGKVVGGVAGFVGHNTFIKDATVEFSDDNTDEASNVSHIASRGFYAGGVFGQSYGELNQIIATYEESLQAQIENNLSIYYSSTNKSSIKRGGVQIFTNSGETQYTSKYIGGLIGYMGGGAISVAYSKINVINMKADYAGGAIGTINSSQAKVFVINNKLEDLDAKAYVNEVYATGDIRANYGAGGILGYAQKDALAVLASVNASNFLSTEYYSDDEDSLESDFSALKVYSLIGGLDSEISSINVLRDSVECARLYSEMEEEMGEAVYERQRSVRTIHKLGSFTIKDFPAEFANESSDMPDISNFANSTQGFFEENGMFLGSELWEKEHWKHEQGNTLNLYPEIRFSLAEELYIYLDNYGQWDTFKRMQDNPGAEVRVRGLVAEGSQEVQDVDLREVFWQKNDEGKDVIREAFKFTNFHGTIKADDNAIITSGPRQGMKPGIILDAPLLQGVAEEGVTLRNLTLIYEPLIYGSGALLRGLFDENDMKSSGSIDAEPGFVGAIVNSDLQSSSLEGVQIILKAPIYLANTTGGAEATPLNNKGLIAGQIISSNLINVSLELDPSSFVDFSSGDPAISIKNSNGGDTNNVGVFAGALIQTSTEKDMIIQNISIHDMRTGTGETKEYSLVSAEITSGSNLSAGGMFGSVEKRADDSSPSSLLKNINMAVSELTHGTMRDGVFRKDDKLETIKVSINGVDGEINVGGYIGKTGSIDSLQLALDCDSEGDTEESTEKTLGNFGINLSGSATADVNAGLVVGQATNGISPLVETESTVGFSFSADNSLLTKGKFTGGVTTSGQTNLGGLIGLYDATQKINIFNTNVSFQVGEEDTPYISSGAVNAGGYLGKSTQPVAIGRQEFYEINEDSGEYNYLNEVPALKINQNAEYINVKGGEVNVGALIGIAGSSVALNPTLTTKEGTVDYQPIVINTNIIAEATSDNASNIGGFIGKVNLASGGELTLGLKNEMEELASQALLKYDGEITAKSNGNIGGMIGGVDISGKASVNLTNFSFGGKINLSHEENLTASIGGTLASMTGGPTVTSETKDINIANNYNYGDVFVDGLKAEATTDNMTFGGIVGKISASLGQNIINNYSLVTYRNTRPGQDTSKVHAMFGDGVVADGLKAQNYYSHSVALLTDDFAVDTGYFTPYDANRVGYGKEPEADKPVIGGFNTKQFTNADGTEIGTIKDVICEAVEFLKDVSDTDKIKYIGHKLYPVEIGLTGAGSAQKETLTKTNFDEYQKIGGGASTPLAEFNGITYFVLTADQDVRDAEVAEEFNGIELTGKTEDEVKTSEGTALVGDGFTIKTNRTNLFAKIADKSLLSAVKVEIDVSKEDNILEVAGEEEEEPITIDRYAEAGLVKELDGGVLYAVGLTGKMSIGGTAYVDMAGLVSDFKDGLISDSYTDVKLIYRAKTKDAEIGYASAVALIGEKDGNKLPVINYTYAVGEIYTYSNASVDAFVMSLPKTSESATVGSAVVRNSYTTVFMDAKDYTSANETTKPGIFTGANSGNYYYDAYAVGYKFEEDDIVEKDDIETTFVTGTGKVACTTDAIIEGLTGNGWTQDENYEVNYGYPTRGFGYSGNRYIKYLQQWDLDEEYTPSTETADITDEIVFGERSHNYDDSYAPSESADTNKYLLIPNLGILNRILSINNGEFIFIRLRNDVQVSLIDKFGDLTVLKNEFNKTLYIDGEGHRFYGSEYPLFDSYNSGYFENIDFMNVATTNVIANTIKYSTIRNVSVSGDMLSGEQIKVQNNAIGIIASSITNSKLENVMNTTMIKYTDSTKTVNIGGIVGTATNSTLKNCTNNGPIRAESTGELRVGGIVGSLVSSNAEYCYNTGYMAVNYNLTESGNRTAYGGGIAGTFEKTEDDTRTHTIDHSYNSGLIKVGSKSLNKDSDSGCGISYAGGIIAADKAKVEFKTTTLLKVQYCINEGSVEALGANGEFECSRYFKDFYHITGEEESRQVSIYQKSDRNVIAYGIGFLCANSNNSYSQAQITRNGAALIKYDGDPSDANPSTDKGVYEVSEKWRTPVKSSQWHSNTTIEFTDNLGDNYGGVNWGDILDVSFMWGSFTTKYTYSDHQPLEEKEVKFSVLSTGEYGQPTAVAAYWYNTFSVDANIEDNRIKATNSQIQAYEIVKEKNTFSEKAATQDYGELQNRLDSGLKTDIINNAKSKKNGLATDILIGGASYYLTNNTASEMITCMGQGSSWTITIAFSGEQAESFKNAENVKVELLKNGSQAEGYKVAGQVLYREEGKLEVTIFKIDNSATALNNITIKATWDECIWEFLDLSDLNYAYYTDGRIEIRNVVLNNISNTTEGIATYAGNGVFEAKVDGIGETLYFQYKNNELTYRPNITLSIDGTRRTVNTYQLKPSQIAGRQIKLAYYENKQMSLPSDSAEITESDAKWVRGFNNSLEATVPLSALGETKNGVYEVGQVSSLGLNISQDDDYALTFVADTFVKANNLTLTFGGEEIAKYNGRWTITDGKQEWTVGTGEFTEESGDFKYTLKIVDGNLVMKKVRLIKYQPADEETLTDSTNGDISKFTLNGVTAEVVESGVKSVKFTPSVDGEKKISVGDVVIATYEGTGWNIGQSEVEDTVGDQRFKYKFSTNDAGELLATKYNIITPELAIRETPEEVALTEFVGRVGLTTPAGRKIQKLIVQDGESELGYLEGEGITEVELFGDHSLTLGGHEFKVYSEFDGVDDFNILFNAEDKRQNILQSGRAIGSYTQRFVDITGIEGDNNNDKFTLEGSTVTLNKEVLDSVEFEGNTVKYGSYSYNFQSNFATNRIAITNSENYTSYSITNVTPVLEGSLSSGEDMVIYGDQLDKLAKDETKYILKVNLAKDDYIKLNEDYNEIDELVIAVGDGGSSADGTQWRYIFNSPNIWSLAFAKIYKISGEDYLYSVSADIVDDEYIIYSLANVTTSGEEKTRDFTYIAYKISDGLLYDVKTSETAGYILKGDYYIANTPSDFTSQTFNTEYDNGVVTITAEDLKPKGGIIRFNEFNEEANEITFKNPSNSNITILDMKFKKKVYHELNSGTNPPEKITAPEITEVGIYTDKYSSSSYTAKLYLSRSGVSINETTAWEDKLDEVIVSDKVVASPNGATYPYVKYERNDCNVQGLCVENSRVTGGVIHVNSNSDSDEGGEVEGVGGYEGIIITRNLNVGTTISSTEYNANTNGNNYAVQYNQPSNLSLFTSIVGGFLKDVNFVGCLDVKDADAGGSGFALLTHTLDSAVYVDVNLFGNIRAVKAQGAKVATVYVELDGTDAEKNIKINSYVSIDGQNGNSNTNYGGTGNDVTSKLYTFGCEGDAKNNSNFYGFVIAGNGGNGGAGEDGYKTKGAGSGGNGGDGGTVGKTEGVNDNGITIQGLGGIGGFGGTGYGAQLSVDYDAYMRESDNIQFNNYTYLIINNQIQINENETENYKNLCVGAPGGTHGTNGKNGGGESRTGVGPNTDSYTTGIHGMDKVVGICFRADAIWNPHWSWRDFWGSLLNWTSLLQSYEYTFYTVYDDYNSGQLLGYIADKSNEPDVEKCENTLKAILDAMEEHHKVF